MDLTKVPAGFALALAQSELALGIYASMGEDQKRMVLEKARRARSSDEMRRIVDTLENSPM